MFGALVLQSVHVFLDAAFEVASFVGVNDVSFGEFVEHGSNLGKESFSGSFICRIAQCFHCVTSCFVIISVPKSAGFGLSDSFLRRFMICHIVINNLNFSSP